MRLTYEEKEDEYVYEDMELDASDLVSAIITNDKLSESKKSKLIARILKEFKAQYPNLQYHATKYDVSETELRLTKEIEDTRKEIKELDVKLTKEIEDTRKEIKELDVKLTAEIKETKSTMIKWSFLFWVSQMGAMIAIGFFVLKALNLK